MNRILLLLALVIGLASPASSQGTGREILYGENDDGAIYYLLPDSAQRSYGSVTVWVRVDHTSDQTVPQFEAMIQWKVSCSERTVALLSYANYDSSGRLTESRTLKSYQIEARPTIPGSIGYSLYEEACSLR